MALSQFRSTKKFTGGLYKKIRKKKKRDFGSDFIPTKLGKETKKSIEGLANITRQRLFSAEFVNVADLSKKATKKVKIQEVLEHSDNPNYTRMDVITKGCVVKTELGKVKITSRPTQHGVVNGILMQQEK